MRFIREAANLGMQHLPVRLFAVDKRLWRHKNDDAFGGVEDAAATHFRRAGWTVCNAEGGLILTLIKAASFPILPAGLDDVFIEAIYAKNVARPEDRFEKEWLLSNIANATTERIVGNFQFISSQNGTTPTSYPAVSLTSVLGLFDALGAERLQAIATLFAIAPYELRAGWPDLTMWRNRVVVFCEVKAPGDRLQMSQRRLISTILQPLGLPSALVEVVI